MRLTPCLDLSALVTCHTLCVRLFAFAGCCVFVKQSHGPVQCPSGHCPGGPLLPKLRGYVAEFLNEVSLARLGILVPSHLCRFWYGRHVGPEGAFLGSMDARPRAGRTLRSSPAFRREKGDFHRPQPLSFSDPRLNPRRSRNVDRVSVDYAFRPRLRCRLTPGGRTCPGKPWDSGGRDSHPAFRYSCPHNR